MLEPLRKRWDAIARSSRLVGASVGTVVAALCLAGGVVGSILGARAVADKDATEAREAFRSDSAQVAAALKQTVQADEDVTAAAKAFLAAQPSTTAAEFDSWVEASGALRRHPELSRLDFVAVPPPARLPTSATSPARALSSAAARPGGSPTAKPSTTAGPPRGTLSPALLALRDSGHSRYRSTTVDGKAALVVEGPVYRGDRTPLTGHGRAAAFVGALRETVLPEAMMNTALQGHTDESARLRYTAGGASVVFGAGAAQAQGQAQAQSTSASLGGGWSARVYGGPVEASVLSDGEALALLITGCAASILAAALVFVLATGRRGKGLDGPAGLGRPGKQGEAGLYDPLTELPSRALTLDRAEGMLARVGRQPGMLSGGLLIDVDWFKDVNSKFGKGAGDQLLRVVAERLRVAARADDTVGRMGDDEFLALVECKARGVRLESLAGRMLEALHEPVEVEGFGPSFHVTASIGIALGRYASADELVSDARLALQASKAAGRDRFTLFNANLRSTIEDSGVLDAELNVALQEGQLFLLYEPIYDLSTRKPVALEALIRWSHPKRGVLGPEEFVAVAEETGMIVPVGRWALEEACTRAAAWSLAAPEPVGVSVGVSAAQVHRDGFVSDVRRALQQSGIEPSLLTLQVEEAAVIGDVEAAAGRLKEIKGLGVRIAIDGFGSGYAHRSDLQKLPLDFLKVERDLLAETDDEDYRSWLLEAIVLFARDLSVGAIAKGVDSDEQVVALQAIGCPMAQGPALGKPMPVDGLAILLGNGAPAGLVASSAGLPEAAGLESAGA